MSDEEKKAIEKVKRIIERYEHKPIEKISVEFDEFDYNLFKLLNLIETLKKENLEIRDWKYTIDTIEDLDKLKELDLIKIKGKEYISKDKIRAKIEEYDKMINATYEDLTYYGDYRRDVCIEIKNILQSLLEEE